uniref:Beta-defensin-like domain-containing protein n=1 Tax=Cyanistes caeruleus TaxID=156563 RepID=A0A8C0ZIS1_CYACU
MKILFLLFPLILLLAQGAAGEREEGKWGNCWKQRGFCTRRICPRGTSFAGRCSPGLACCKR